METLYRLSYWGLSPCGNELKHTLDEGMLKTIRSTFLSWVHGLPAAFRARRVVLVWQGRRRDVHTSFPTGA
ncbi:hypothetical protein ABZS61_28095 [Streptomyces sp. NPDC005566]|uniref:hypothetical protein n=1 Tax=Streptomyces sp. NPDC005566 TaxID=3156886 RepID=UPI0033A3B416